MSIEKVRVIHCSLMGMGNDHLCKKFSEKRCMLCQLKNRYNNTYSLIVNDVDIDYSKKHGVDGLVLVLTPKKGSNPRKKEYINTKLVELFAIRELIDEIECSNLV